MNGLSRLFPLVRASALVVLLGLMVSGCGINTIPTQEENAKAKWSDVLNQYQRRADLIPNLVETVKGYAAQEKQVLEAVINAGGCPCGRVMELVEALADPQVQAQEMVLESNPAGPARSRSGCSISARFGSRKWTRPSRWTRASSSSSSSWAS